MSVSAHQLERACTPPACVGLPQVDAIILQRGDRGDAQ